ncbi:MAG: hypothetical protein PHE68_00470 [Candidatus Peribacteraceae bacterium]|nr:hypothetical protein [Candidatus Peribacteraceae bacterium]MDD5074523.1 hypothetical protein [Candidatus Peribacteraceae bacterium]
MLRRLRERLTLFLLAALPFHALLVTAGTKLIAGPGHAPLTVIALWKEFLLGIIVLLVVLEWVSAKWKMDNGKWIIDVIDVLIIALLVLSLVVTIMMRVDVKTALYGFKYDFLPLVAFFMARRVPWSEWFVNAVSRTLIVVGCIVAVYGIVGFLLPQKFFLRLGYSSVHSLYFADGPLAAFQQIGDTSLRRVQSSMSGPNQLGLWLLIPWCIVLVRLLKERRWILLLPLGLIGLALLMSFSRSAFLGGFVATLIALRIGLSPRIGKKVFYGFLTGCVALGIILVLLFPQVFWRLGSTRGHLTRPILAMQEVLRNPLGQGLGMAGPASTHLRDTCVFLRAQDDPAWAKNIPKLCVFVGGVKVQPTDRECVCPNLPENWYIQIGVELGIMGFLLFVVLVLAVLLRFISDNGKWIMENGQLSIINYPLRIATLLSFLALSVAALFLHAWEDSAVAYTVWLLTAFFLASFL